MKICEGPKARLSQVCFDGNRSFSDDRLISFFKLGNWFNQRDIEGSLEEIRKLYESEGYIRVAVRHGWLDIFEKRALSYFPIPFRFETVHCASFHCRITEGEQYFFGKVILPAGLEAADVAIPAESEVFREHDLEDLRKRVVLHLKQEGKLAKKLRVLQHVNEVTHCVDIRVELEVYPLLLIGNIEFTGNNHLPDSFYRRELAIHEKSIFHPLELERSLSRLAETGALRSISAEDVELAVDEGTLEVDVLFHLKERGCQGIFYSFGPGQYGGLDASLAYSVLNLAGLGDVFGIELNAGDTSSGFAVQLASRYLLGTNLPISTLFGFFRRHTGFRLPGVDEEISDLFGVREAGLSGQFDYRVHSKQSVGAGVSLARRGSGTRHLVFAPYLKRERQLKVAQRLSLLQGSEHAWNLRPSLDWYPQAGEKLRLRITGAHATFFGDPQPLSERLFLGPNHVRGLSWSGPIGINGETPECVGGDTLLSLNSEYVVPLAGPVSLVPFFDVGWSAALARFSQYEILENSNRLARSSTGSEVRVRVPRFTELRLIFSWNPLRLETGSDLNRFREPPFSFRVGFDRW